METSNSPRSPALQFGYEAWLEGGACRPFPTAWWFSTDPGETAAANAICADCPVRAECLEFAVSRPALLGVWAATKPAERAAIRNGAMPRQPAYAAMPMIGAAGGDPPRLPENGLFEKSNTSPSDAKPVV